MNSVNAEGANQTERRQNKARAPPPQPWDGAQRVKSGDPSSRGRAGKRRLPSKVEV